MSEAQEAAAKEYQATLNSNPYTPTIRRRGGRGGGHWVQAPNPQYQQYNQKAKEEYNRKLGQIKVKESGITLEQIRLSRTASSIFRGISAGQGDRHVQYQVSIARANDDILNNRIGVAEYQTRVQQAKTKYHGQQQEFTLQKARSAAKTLKSETIKQDTQRAIAAQHGVAVGTIQSDGTGAVSNQSSVANNVTVSNFVNEQKPTTQIQRENKVKVTTPDGKERTFKDRETAERFVSRVDNNYKVEVQGAVRPPPSYPVYFYQEPVVAPTSMSQLNDRKFVPQIQDYPRSYSFSNIKPEEVARGIWEGGIMPLAQLALMPKPIISDIIGRTESEERILKKSVETVKEIIPDKPTVLGSTIQQVSEGKPITGTGEGLSYDIGSAGFDIGTAVIPASKGSYAKVLNPAAKMTIPIVKQTIIGAPVTRMETVASGLTVGSRGTTIISKTESGLHLGKPPVKDLKLESLSPEIGSRGYQLSTKEPFVQKIIQSDEAIEAIGANLGQKTVKTLRDLSADMPKAPSPIVRDLPEGSVTSFKPEEHAGLVGVLTKPLKKVQFKGGISQILTVEGGRGVTSDVDAFIGKLEKTKELARRAQDYLNVPGRLVEGRTAELTSKGTKVEIGGEKAIELLTDRETIDYSTTLKEADTFWGATPKTKGIKSNEGIKVDSLGTQTIHKGMSVATLQGAATKNLDTIPYLKKPLPDRYMGAVDFRLVKDTSDLIDDLTQIGINYQQKGNQKLAEKFIGGAKTIEKEWGEFIDFKKFKDDAAAGLIRDKTTATVQESRLSSISKTLTKDSTVSAVSSKLSLTSRLSVPESRSQVSKSSSSITSKTSKLSSTTSAIKEPSSVLPSAASQLKIKGSVGSGSISSIGSTSSAIRGGSAAKPPVVKSSVVKSSAVKGIVEYYTAKAKFVAAPQIPWTAKRGKPKPRKNKPREDFLGNTRVAEIQGFRTKKSDVTYGKKTESLFQKDLKKTKKKFTLKW